ncbi:hypothetical protein [Neptunicella sp. SCSIO 80796]|uniref:hypothetical protein n=1 Tax=Neptunicella plasticusilytica TaxID=3117012 RepID=UPI003A4D7585
MTGEIPSFLIYFSDNTLDIQVNQFVSGELLMSQKTKEAFHPQVVGKAQAKTFLSKNTGSRLKTSPG